MKRASLLTAVLCVLAVALCGCAGLGAAPTVPTGDDWTSNPTKIANLPPSPSPPAVPVDKVSAAQQALTATLGIQVFWAPESSASIATNANQIFNYIVGLGANTVGINFFFYTNGVDPTYVYSGSLTPTPAMIGQITAIARAHGLRVLIRPLLNEDNIIDARGDWRGSIEPPSFSAWFASYFSFLTPYFAAAQANGATSFNIGTELDSLADDEPDWTTFEASAAKLFSGQLEYAVNYGRWQEVPTYEPVPDAAVDAYPQLGVGDSVTVPELTTAWVHWLQTQPESVLQKTVLQEVGIGAVAGAYAEPARSYQQGTPLDVPIQTNWFASACAAAKQVGMAGIYFYDVNGTDQPSDPAAYNAYPPGSFIGRSDGAIKACFASGWS